MNAIMWLLIGIFLYLVIGYIFIYLTDAYEDGFWMEFKIILLWPVLVIIFGICCIYFCYKELYKKVKNEI
jgi:intracellular septation protein A